MQASYPAFTLRILQPIYSGLLYISINQRIFPMSKKPTYEEMEQRVKGLEKEAIKRRQAEEALESERDKLKSLLDGLTNTGIGVDIVSTDYEVLQQNQTLIDRFGDIVGKKCYKEYMTLDEPCSFCPMVKALENKRLERAELRGADGRDYELLAAPLTNPDGTVDKAIEVVQDITDRKQAEKELLFKENIISSSSSVIATCDLDGNMTYCNPSFLKAWGFDDVKEILGKPFGAFWVVNDILDEIMQALTSKGKWLGEIKAKRKDGTLFDVQVSAAMVYDIEGKPIALTSTSIAITDRKQAEEALRESEERYRSLFNNKHFVMLLIDPESADIVDANPAAISYYGWNHKELTSKKIADINTLTEEQVFQEIEKAKLEQRRHFIFRHRLSNGDIRDVEVYSGPLQLRGKQLLCSIVHDITDRKQAEEEREKLINELQEALKEIKTLRGILPLCSYCKKIRDDKGYWEQVDVYIHKHSQADISHGICPECAKEHYPDLDIYDD
jgi:PAS domain S-box-containing protein